jgi:ubiquinone/menaquinone biosynthesis C-methylase UbiE
MSVELDMVAYYAQRAAYYERVYFKPERQTNLRAMEAWIREPFVGRHVLELACGTGWWTPHAAVQAQRWLATDVNDETLAIARAKPALPACVEFALVDAYTLEGLGDTPFDAAFTGCWWSHVPLQRLPQWLATLHAKLLPGARVVMLDNRFVQTSSTPIHRQDDHGNTYQWRTLDDGNRFEVVKNFPTLDSACALLGPRARNPRWHAWEHYWALEYELA